MSLRSRRIPRALGMVVLVGVLVWVLSFLILVQLPPYERLLLACPGPVKVPFHTLPPDPPQRLAKSSQLVAHTHKPVKKPLQIALMSSFVVQKDRGALLSDRLLQQHLLNKACYAELWGYEYRLNTQWGFDRTAANATRPRTDHRYWLDFGHWHRVPALQAIQDDYDWILYADLDYVIQDWSIPLESFLKEWESTGHANHVHAWVPHDGDDMYTFSSYAILLRGRSNFTRALLDHWAAFAKGLCPAGNFPNRRGPTSVQYSWEQSDQPGLWYALAKTHAQHVGASPAWEVPCDPNTGFLNSTTSLFDEVNAYFASAGLVRGSHLNELRNVPRHQPILFSTYSKEHRCGLGVQRNWASEAWGHYPFRDAFAWHWRYDLPRHFKSDIQNCISQKGCFARYSNNDTSRLELGCTGQPNMVY